MGDNAIRRDCLAMPAMTNPGDHAHTPKTKKENKNKIKIF